jgi:feruloyl esterase
MTALKLAPLAIALLLHAPAYAATCEALKNLALPQVTITLAESRPAGAFTPPAGKPVDKLPAFCRVAGVIRPTADSHIEFETWMPASGWNGKFQGIGNGGFAGNINYGPGGLGWAIQRGYAAGSTDTGHKADGTDASWALGHPEKIVDYGHRAIHLMTIHSKAIVEAFYGRAPRRSYFAACSNGGRQGLMEAQRYPGDYDGIVSFAPAAAWTEIMSGFIWNLQALKDAASHIPPAKMPALEAAVLSACDERDGTKDGVVGDPMACGFDPTKMVCDGSDKPTCLTAQQAAGLRKIYQGPPRFIGFDPGAEGGAGGWSLWIMGQEPGRSLQATFARQFMENMVNGRAGWEPASFNMVRDREAIRAKFGPILNATNPDLTAFHKRGGKLILAHGWADAALPVRATIDYYNAVRAKMGASAADSFTRLYLIPGLQHCTGGPGPTFCGGLTVPIGAPENDLSAALELWVEKGIAPGAITAVQYKREFDPPSGIVASRVIQPYKGK